MRKFVKQKVIFILLMVCMTPSVNFATDVDFEYKLKALYITRLADFIIWPETTNRKAFKICIDKMDKVAAQLRALDIKRILNRKLELVDKPDSLVIKQCDFLYLSAGKVPPLLENIAVFTLSSQPGFSEQGGMIEFYLDQSKVRMKVNLKAVNKVGIKLSSKLERLLKVVVPLEDDD
ncbi:MAG: YfiR family protein [Methylococcales bacterium]